MKKNQRCPEKLRYCFLDLNCVEHRRFHLDKGSAIESEGGRFLGAQHGENYSRAGGAARGPKMRSGAREQFSLLSPADFWIISTHFFSTVGRVPRPKLYKNPRTRLRFGRWSANPVLPRFFSRTRQFIMIGSERNVRIQPADWPVSFVKKTFLAPKI